MTQLKRTCLLTIGALSSVVAHAVSWGVSDPAGTIAIVLEEYAHNRSDATCLATVHKTTGYETPIVGRPWKVVDEQRKETTRNNREYTGYDFHYYPSPNNVERIELKVWAACDPGFKGLGIKPPSTWLGMKMSIRMAPYGQTRAEVHGADIESDKIRRIREQSDELAAASVDIALPELILEIERQVWAFRGEGLPAADAVLGLEAIRTRDLKRFDEVELRIGRVVRRWEMVADCLKDILLTQGIPLFDPTIKALAQSKIDLNWEKRVEFSVDVNAAIEFITGAVQPVEVPPAIASLTGSFRFIDAGASFGSVHRFFRYSYCTEPTYEAAVAFGEPIGVETNEAKWLEMFVGRTDLGLCQ